MYTPALYLLTLVAMMLTSAGVVRLVPGIGKRAGASIGRFGALDGLRGLLASSVLVHHAWIARQHYAGGAWDKPSQALYQFAGDGAVAVFFMITGLLFWDKALSGNLRFKPLLQSRIRRLVPLHLFCGIMVVAICLALQGPAQPDSLARTASRIVRWFLPFAGTSSIHGVPTLLVDAGVTWSLSYEWTFYLLLIPLAAGFVRTGRFLVLVLGMSVLAWLAWSAGWTRAREEVLLTMDFLCGMLIARLLRTRWAARWQATVAAYPGWCAVAVAATVVAVVLGQRQLTSGVANLALMPAFAAIVLGCDLFGLLRMRWMRWLGHISFSVYLLHGIVLLGVLRLINDQIPVAQLDEGIYLAIVALIGVAVVCSASLSYELIERPFFDRHSRLRQSWESRPWRASVPWSGARSAARSKRRTPESDREESSAR